MSAKTFFSNCDHCYLLCSNSETELKRISSILISLIWFGFNTFTCHLCSRCGQARKFGPGVFNLTSSKIIENCLHLRYCQKLVDSHFLRKNNFVCIPILLNRSTANPSFHYFPWSNFYKSFQNFFFRKILISRY